MPRRLLLHILLLWLAGNALRLTILAVPPVIPAIHQDLGLSATGVGILGGLPVVLFAAAALPGSLLIARLGPVRALVVGLMLAAGAGALRGAVATVAWLYAMTMLMGAGVAIMQPALPALVRLWAPHRIGFATAVYSNGLLVGETLPVLMMIPLVLPLVGGSWPLGLAVWSLPVVAIAALVVWFAGSALDKPATTEPPRWWPDWRDGLIWRLGLTFGAVNAMYFGANTFLPDYLTSHGRPDLISAALGALNFGQLPASVLLLVLASRLERRIWPYLAFGLLCLASAFGWPCRDGQRLDRAVGRRARLLGLRGADPSARAAAASMRAGRRGADLRRDADGQLHARRDHCGRQRHRLGRDGDSGCRLRADWPVRLAARLGPGDHSVRPPRGSRSLSGGVVA
jgi:MFS transporter, CP family, cyanate transporter